jgi:hypothetical protein
MPDGRGSGADVGILYEMVAQPMIDIPVNLALDDICSHYDESVTWFQLSFEPY